MIKKLIKWEYIALLGICFILFFPLLHQPILGVANNGEFQKYFSSIGLAYKIDDPAQTFFHVPQRQFAITEKEEVLHLSSQNSILQLSKSLNTFFYSDQTFDIRFLGLVYGLILLAGILLFYGSLKKENRWFLSSFFILVTLIGLDKGVLAYFNSFYLEAATYAFLMLFLGSTFYLIRKPKWTLPVALLASVSFFFVTTVSFLNFFFIPFFSYLLIRICWVRKSKIMPILFACSLLATLWFAKEMMEFQTKQQKEITQVDTYHALFSGVLKYTDTPQETMKELQIPKDLAPLIGTGYFQETAVQKSHPDVLNAYQQMGFSDRLSYYAMHGSQLWTAIKTSASHAYQTELYYLGDIEGDPGKEKKESIWITTKWSEFKQLHLSKNPAYLLGMVLAVVAAAIYYYREEQELENKVSIEFLLMIVFATVLQFMLPFVHTGDVELAKHLFNFNILFDFSFLFILLAMVYLIDNNGTLKKKQRSQAPLEKETDAVLIEEKTPSLADPQTPQP